MRKNKNVLIILLIGIISVGLITTYNIQATVSNRPDFDISISVTPEEAMVGENIIVNGTITPKPFETEVPAKEIVLVLDVSGSMQGSKITNLKNATKKFVEKMKDVPNLKIGIVTYSSTAEIKRKMINWSNSIALIPSSDTKTLNEIIDGLRANGGTNTGEGLRRATYLLKNNYENNPSANKTIVLMSDGIPTYYTRVSDKNNNYFSDITVESGGNSYNSGDGSDDTRELVDLGYAKVIGELIKKEGYNAFTIGYGMNDTGNNRMSQIHSSMTGKDMSDTSTSDQEKGFYPTSDGAIEGVFESIAQKILDSYPLTNIQFNFNEPQNFTLDIGGNVIAINDIVYKKVSESNGKVRYEADPVSFSFVIKANKPGYYDTLFKDSTITFPWNGQTITNKIPSVGINIKDNVLPNIEAKLKNPKPNPVNIGDDIEVAYDIVPEEFIFNSSDDGTGAKDVVILLDVSNAMSGSNKFIPILNGIDNKFVTTFTNNRSNVQFSIVTYSDKVNTFMFNGKPFSNSQGDLHKEILSLHNTNFSSDQRNIGEALQVAQNILECEFSNPEASKNIVMISAGEVNYNGFDVNGIRSKGYNVISVEVQKEKNVSFASFKNLHSSLGSTADKYISSKPDGGNYNDLETVMKNAADKLATAYIPVYKLLNSKLEFDIGQSLTAISGFSKIDGKRATVNLPTITYKYNNGRYQAETFEIKFVLRVDEYGELSFEKNTSTNLNNYISYNKLDNTISNIAIQTPLITVNNELPKINAILQSGQDYIENGVTQKIINSNINSDINISYKIQPEEFEFNNANKQKQDVVIVLDKTANGTGNMWDKVKESINTKFIDEFASINNINIGLVTFDQDGKCVDELGGLRNDYDNIKKEILSINASTAGDWNVTGKIEGAIKIADSILKESKLQSKNIVMLTYGDIAPYSETEVEFIKEKDYRIFTVYADAKSYDNINIKNIHEFLSKTEDERINNYIYNVGNMGVDLKETLMEKLRARLEIKLVNEYVIKNSKLTFDLAQNFTPIRGLDSENNKNVIKLPDIIYKLTEVNGKKLYIANEFNVDFTIKANKIGELYFGTPNTFSYRKLNAKEDSIFDIETPKIIINATEIKHGIYGGQNTESKEPMIDESEKVFSKGANVPLATTFEVYSNSTVAKLNIDAQLQLSDVPKLYKINEDGSYTYVAEMVNNTFAFNETLKGEFIILYNVILPDSEGSYKTTIDVDKTLKDAKIKVGPEELPDLF